MRRTIQTHLFLAAGGGLLLLLALVVAGMAADPPARDTGTAAGLEARFRREVRPFLETYCLGCHGKEKPKGDWT